MKKTWKQRIGKKLLKHVKETTTYGTLREVKANVAALEVIARGMPDQPFVCWECRAILRKLGKLT